MTETPRKSWSSSLRKAHVHLCVLVHGLWGNPNHLNYVAQAIRDRYSEDQLIVYSVKRNTGSLTYDGIEIGAERVAKEIEDTIKELEEEGTIVNKFSIVGYSLGGVVARYAVGLLDHKGYFDRIQPINFTTFATPHLGVRTPLLGYQNTLWNVIAARTLSASGRQLFLTDNFRGTGRPLFSVLADPESIFIHALAKFRHRTLYTNIVNDRSAVYYTTSVSRFDPYVNIDKLHLNYVKGYDPVILDPDQPYEITSEPDLSSLGERLKSTGQTIVRRTPIVLALVVLVPVAVTAFMLNAAYQTFRSQRRIQLHEKDEEGLSAAYRIPFLIQDVRMGLEDAYENVNSTQRQDYLPEEADELMDAPPSPLSRRSTRGSLSLKKTESGRISDFPTLALTAAQFDMIKALDDVGFRKYPVYIHKVHHSHAAIIVRMPRASFEEGRVVVKHWLDNEFEL